MGRIRSLKPEFHAHEDLSMLPAETHLLAAAILNYADDEGYFNANPVLLKAGTTPLRSDQTKLEEQVQQLEAVGYIEVRRKGSKSLGWVVNFLLHQRVSHPTPSRLKAQFEELASNREPPPAALAKSSVVAPAALRPEGKGKELNGMEGKGKEQPALPGVDEFAIPDWIDRKALDRFLAMRKKIRKPVAPEAMPLLVRELEKLRAQGNDPTAVLDRSALNSWQGLFPLQGAGSQQRPDATVGMGSQSQMSEAEIEELRARMEAKRGMTEVQR